MQATGLLLTKRVVLIRRGQIESMCTACLQSSSPNPAHVALHDPGSTWPKLPWPIPPNDGTAPHWNEAILDLS